MAAYTQRTAAWVLQKAFMEFKGKATPPAVTDSKYQLLLDTIDSEQKEWANEPDVEWNSLYQLFDCGTITATDTFTVNANLDYASEREGDYVRLVSSDGTQTQQVALVAPNQLYQYRYQLACSINGRNVMFSKPFVATDTWIGYSLKVPGITIINDITSGSDLIQCDEPMYLAMKVAANVARNDVVKVGQYGNILAKASVYMQKMKQKNGGQRPEATTVPGYVMGQSWV